MSRLLTEPDKFFSYARLYASSVASILAWGFRAKDLDSFWFKDVSKMIEQVSDLFRQQSFCGFGADINAVARGY